MSSCGNQQDEAGTASPEQVLMTRKRKIKERVCMRCKKERGTFSRLSILYCKPCFIQAYQTRLCKTLYAPLTPNPPHKVSSQPSTYRPGTQDGDVMLAVSRGAGSMSLMDWLFTEGFVGSRETGNEGVKGGEISSMDQLAGLELQDAPSNARRGTGTRKGSKQPVKAPIWRRCYVVHVDFSNLIPSMPDRSDLIRQHLTATYAGQNLAVDFIPLKIEDAYDSNLSTLLSRSSTPTSSSRSATLIKLQGLLSSVPPPSRPHIIHQLLSSLLEITASSLPSLSHLLLGETSTRLAQRIISGTANGGGWGLPLELATSRALPSRMPGGNKVVRIKPLKDSMVKEAAYYCHLRRIETSNWNGWDGFVPLDVAGGQAGGNARKAVGDSRGKGGVNSLERLTEDFINGLMVTHPSTVSTITRTGSKLMFRGKGDDLETVCPLCGLPSEPSTKAWKARTALTALPRLQNLAGPTGGDNPSALPTKHDSLTDSLCYACLTALEPALDRTDSTTAECDQLELPFWVRDRLGVGMPGVAPKEDEDDEEGHLIESHHGGKEMTRDEMKEVVGEFLMGDEDD